MDITTLKPLKNSKLETTSVSWYWYIDDKNLGDLSNIFKGMIPTEDVPYMSWNRIHKLYRGISEVSSEWNNVDSNLIIAQHRKSPKSDEYTEIQIQYDPDESKYSIVFDLDAQKKDEKNIDQIYEDVNSMFPATTKFTKPVRTNVSGTINVDVYDVKSYILLDIITNDDAVSKYLSVDEFEQITKGYLTIGFHRDGRNAIPATFTFTVTQPKDSTWTKIKIRKQQSIEDINSFIEIITRVFAYYEKRKNEIRAEYAEFGITEKDLKAPSPASKNVGEKTRGVSRTCPKSRAIMSFETREAAEAARASPETIGVEHVLEFPIGESDAKYYACTNPANPYPGLVRQTGATEGKPILCCFAKPQVGKPNSEWSKYTNPDEYIKTSYSQTYQLGENKPIQTPGQTGDIPSSLSYLNKFTEIDENNKKIKVFLRMGVVESTRSIINCILTAKNQSIPNVANLLDDVPKQQYITAKQELYDHSIYEIEKLAKDISKPMKYSDFASFLEYTYQINLAVFSYDGIVIPRSKYGSRKRKTTYPTVILFEQPNFNYELVCQIHTKPSRVKETIFMFPANEDIALSTTDLLQNAMNFNVNNVEFEQFHPVIPNGWKLVSQNFDSFGKTRRLNIMDQTTNKILGFQTTPLQPYNVPEDITKFVKPYSEEDKQLFISLIPEILATDEYTIIENYNELIVSLDTFEMTIPITTEGNASPDPTISTTPRSDLKTFIAFRRISRYLVENIHWLYANNSSADIADRIIIDPKHKYTNITKIFSFDSGIYRDGKIVVPTNKTKERLLFSLNMTLLRTPEKFDKYKQLSMVPNFYMDVTDFIDVYAKKDDDPRNLTNMSFNVYTGDNIFVEMDTEIADENVDEEPV